MSEYRIETTYNRLRDARESYYARCFDERFISPWRFPSKDDIPLTLGFPAQYQGEWIAVRTEVIGGIHVRFAVVTGLNTFGIYTWTIFDAGQILPA